MTNFGFKETIHVFPHQESCDFWWYVNDEDDAPSPKELANFLGYRDKDFLIAIRDLENVLVGAPAGTKLILRNQISQAYTKEWLTPSRRPHESVRGFKSRVRNWVYQFLTDEDTYFNEEYGLVDMYCEPASARSCVLSLHEKSNNECVWVRSV